MDPSGRLHHANSETTLIIARRSRSELIAPFIPFSKSPLCACTSFAILSKRASHRRGGGCVRQLILVRRSPRRSVLGAGANAPFEEPDCTDTADSILPDDVCIVLIESVAIWNFRRAY